MLLKWWLEGNELKGVCVSCLVDGSPMEVLAEQGIKAEALSSCEAVTWM
jgi:hypothetical protein